jgi:GT2 family glycosyltransferase
VIARRSCLNELGGFNTDPEIHMCEDLDLWLRALHAGARFAFSKHVSAYYRKHPAAATSRQGYMACQSAYVLNVNEHRVNAPWLSKKTIIAAKWWAAFNTLTFTDHIRLDVLLQAIRTSLPVPWEALRGLVHLFRGWQKKF